MGCVIQSCIDVLIGNEEDFQEVLGFKVEGEVDHVMKGGSACIKR
jgi:hypothetical protein